MDILRTRVKQFLIDLLEKQYGVEVTDEIISGYAKEKITSLRVNLLKSNDEEIEEYLLKNQIVFEKALNLNHAYILKNITEKEILSHSIVKEGKVYLQSLSSQIPPLVLNPKESTVILDMAAAPGGKTSQIASMTLDKAQITACEVNKIRYQKLVHILDIQGVKSCYVMLMDSKKLDDFFSFDQILLDAPCSGSGTLDISKGNATDSFSYQLIKNSSKLQTELLKKALKILKPGHDMVYSTCSILEMENEEVVKQALKGNGCEIIPIDIKGLPLLKTSIEGTICVKPTDYYEGFFVAHIKKK